MIYHYTLRNIPEELRSHLLRFGSLKITPNINVNNQWSCTSAPSDTFMACIGVTLPLVSLVYSGPISPIHCSFILLLTISLTLNCNVTWGLYFVQWDAF